MALKPSLRGCRPKQSSALIFWIVSSCFALLAITARADNPPISRGEYLAALGDCTSCHTKPGGKKFAGGYPMGTPFGIIYGANITPDREYGIGNYTFDDFKRAVRQGIAKDGTHLYPAMPYTSFAKMSDDDVKALYDYFLHEVQPVHEKPPETRLPFPFNQRWTLALWDLVFLDDQRYQPKRNHDDAWNRGAYLVQSLGHCGACHTPRGPAYEELGMSESSPFFLSGQVLDHWFAPDLNGDNASGLKRWSKDDISSFLANGYGAGTAAFGSMKEVVENSGQYMTEQDRAAIAQYLKSLKASGEKAKLNPHPEPDDFEHPGAGLYANFCVRCHGANGEGKLPRIPMLAGNPSVLSDDPTSVIHIVMKGDAAPQTQDQTVKPARMPAFGAKFTDREIADVVTFIRSRWGNDAPAATEGQVGSLRKKLLEEPAASTIPAKMPSTGQ